MNSTTTAAEDAGYLGAGGSASSYAAMGSSLLGAVGGVLDAVNRRGVAKANSYNFALQNATNIHRTHLQNYYNQQTAFFNIQELAAESAGLRTQAFLNNSRTQAQADNRAVSGSGGVISETPNAGGTLDFLAAGIQQQSNERKRFAHLQRLAQGYQTPLPVQEYKYRTPWDQVLKGVAGNIKSVSDYWEQSQVGNLKELDTKSGGGEGQGGGT